MAMSARKRPAPETKPRRKAKSRSRLAAKSKSARDRVAKSNKTKAGKIKTGKTSTNERTEISADKRLPARRMLSILLTGFGPFPGAPFNPSARLAERLARGRRPAFAGVHLRAHVFPTSYAAVDRDLPTLIERYRPDAILMFGLGSRALHIRIETQARNALSSFADATGFSQRKHVIAAKGPSRLQARLPVQRLVGAARARGIPAKPARDAGHYVCNYLLWRAIEATTRPQGPRLAAFVHVPRLRRAGIPRSRVRRRKLSAAELHRAGEAILLAIVTAARR